MYRVAIRHATPKKKKINQNQNTKLITSFYHIELNQMFPPFTLCKFVNSIIQKLDPLEVTLATSPPMDGHII